ncbi:MAG: tRNA 4-thiouridine(8) synthase ThiI, partial [Sulfurovaceae bacterium]|nr:tRNA 4-thiouridine(8) synthase ThiI [Sulfurovaceae bacterium]
MVKGSSAKKQMIGQLYNNIVKLLGEIDSDLTVKKFSDKLEVVTPIEVVDRVRERLLNTSGVEQVLEALQFDNMEELDDIKAKVCEISAGEIVDKTFVVRAKRSGKHSFNSSEMERTIGGYMLAHTTSSKGVDLHNPEVTIKIELINKQLNIITQKHMGLGGFPIG